MSRAKRTPDQNPIRVVIVGPCASGKSTLAQSLRVAGYEAYVCGQEHSIIRSLWAHLDPDVAIALDVDLDTIRKRRGETWPASLYGIQIDRLKQARGAADLVVDTSNDNERETLRKALLFLQDRKSIPH